MLRCSPWSAHLLRDGHQRGSVASLDASLLQSRAAQQGEAQQWVTQNKSSAVDKGGVHEQGALIPKEKSKEPRSSNLHVLLTALGIPAV